MVLDSPGGCCEAICAFCLWNINGFGFSRRLLWSHLLIFLLKYFWFWILQEAVVKPFAICFVEILMVLDYPGGCCEAICTFVLFKYLYLFIIHEVVVKPFAFFVKILMVLDSPGGCCEAICKFCCLNIEGFGFSRRLLWSHFHICLLKY